MRLHIGIVLVFQMILSSALSAQVAHTFLIDEIEGTASYSTVDLSTFEVTTKPSTGLPLTSIADGPDGTLYAADPSGLWTIDPGTGAATFVGPLGTTVEEVHGMTWDGAQNRLVLRVVDVYFPIIPYYGSAYLAVDPESGAATTLDSEVGGLLWRFAHDGSRFLGWTMRNLYEIVPETGEAFVLSDNLDSITPAGLDFDAAGRLWMLGTPFVPVPPPYCQDQFLFRVDLEDGAADYAGGESLSCRFTGLAVTGPVTIVEIPTLGSAALATLAGLLLLVATWQIARRESPRQGSPRRGEEVPGLPGHEAGV